MSPNVDSAAAPEAAEAVPPPDTPSSRASSATPQVGIVICTASGRCVFANDVVSDLAEVHFPRFVQRAFHPPPVFPTPPLPHTPEFALAGQQPRAREIQRFADSGEELWTQWFEIPLVLNGEPLLLYTAWDISKQKRVEAGLSAQRDLARSLAHVVDVPTVLGLLLDAALSVSGIDCGGIYMVNQQSGALVLKAHRGLSRKFVDRVAFYPPDSEHAQVLAQGRPLTRLSLPVEQDLAEALESDGITGLALVPIIQEGRLVGSLNLGSHVWSELPPSSRTAAEALAGLAAGTIACIQADTNIRELNAELDCRVRERTAELLVVNEQLSQHQNELRTLLDNSPDLVVRCDRRTRSTYVNPAGAQFCNRTPEEVLGRRLCDLGLPEALCRLAEETCKRVFATAQPVTVEIVHPVNGATRCFEARHMPEFAPDGTVASVLVVGRDVTERKRAEEEIREAHLRARALADAAFEGIVFHEHGTILEANARATTMFGVPLGTAGGRSVLDFIAPDSHPVARQKMAEDDVASYESIGVRTDGSRFPIELQARHFDYQGRRIRVVAVRDLTLKKQDQERIRKLEQEESLKREQAQRESFVRQLMEAQELERKRIAIELHDSLGQNALAIKHRAERALAAPDQPERMQESLAAIAAVAAETVVEIRSIVQQLYPYLLGQLGLTRALRAMVAAIGDSSSIRFASEIADADKTLHPDSEIVLYRVLQECVNNVAKHSQATEARLCVHREPNRLCALVQDNGRGFDFDRVSQPGAPGAGLGLRSIAERMSMIGGSLQVVSRPGQGTRVELHVPLQPNPAPAPPPEHPPSTQHQPR